MAKKQRSDEQVEDILESLSGIEKAEPRPFFFTRLQARMAVDTDPSIWGRMMSYLSRPAVSLASLLVFLLINGYILINALSKDTSPAIENTQAIAYEYAEIDNQYAYLNQENP